MLSVPHYACVMSFAIIPNWQVFCSFFFFFFCPSTSEVSIDMSLRSLILFSVVSNFLLSLIKRHSSFYTFDLRHLFPFGTFLVFLPLCLQLLIYSYVLSTFSIRALNILLTDILSSLFDNSKIFVITESGVMLALSLQTSLASFWACFPTFCWKLDVIY